MTSDCSAPWARKLLGGPASDLSEGGRVQRDDEHMSQPRAPVHSDIGVGWRLQSACEDAKGGVFRRSSRR